MQMRGLVDDGLVRQVDLLRLEASLGEWRDKRHAYYELTVVGQKRCASVRSARIGIEEAISGLLTVKGAQALHSSIKKVSDLAGRGSVSAMVAGADDARVRRKSRRRKLG